MESKDWKKRFRDLFVDTYGEKDTRMWRVAYQPIEEIEDFISTLLEEARKEGREEIEREYREYRLEQGELE